VRRELEKRRRVGRVLNKKRKKEAYYGTTSDDFFRAVGLDLPFDQFCAKVSSFGYDGVEIACWGGFLF